MKLIKIKRENGSYRLAHKPEGSSMTDQSDKNYLDINNIMKNYAKTGLLPQFKEKVAQYLDMTQIPSYIEAHEQITHAKNLFEQLPSEVRKLMENKPENLEKVLSNPDYKQIMQKYGLIKKDEPKKQPKGVEQSDAQGKPAVQATNKEPKPAQ